MEESQNVVNEVNNEVVNNEIVNNTNIENVKPKKKKPILLIVVIVLLLVLLGFGYYWFFIYPKLPKNVYFKIIDKSNDSILNYFDTLNSMLNKTYGNEFELTFDVEKNDSEIGKLADVINNIKVSGSTEMDYQKKLFNYAFKTVYKEDALIDGEFSIENDTFFARLKGLYDKTPYYKNEFIGKIWDSSSISDLKIVYTEMVKYLKKNLKDNYFSSSNETITIKGKEYKTIKEELYLTEEYSKEFAKNMTEDLKNSDAFVTSFAKLSGISKEKLISEMVVSDSQKYSEFKVQLYINNSDNKIVKVVIPDEMELEKVDDDKYEVYGYVHSYIDCYSGYYDCVEEKTVTRESYGTIKLTNNILEYNYSSSKFGDNYNFIYKMTFNNKETESIKFEVTDSTLEEKIVDIEITNKNDILNGYIKSYLDIEGVILEANIKINDNIGKGIIEIQEEPHICPTMMDYECKKPMSIKANISFVLKNNISVSKKEYTNTIDINNFTMDDLEEISNNYGNSTARKKLMEDIKAITGNDDNYDSLIDSLTD